MKEQELNYIKKLIDKDISNNDRESLEKLKNYLTKKLSISIYNNSDILNLNLIVFLKNEIPKVKILRQVRIYALCNHLAKHYNIPNSDVLVKHLIEVDSTWLVQQNYIGPQTIITLNTILNQYNFSLKDISYQNINNISLKQLLRVSSQNDILNQKILEELSSYWQISEGLITVNKLCYLDLNDPLVQNTLDKNVITYLNELFQKYHIEYKGNSAKSQEEILNLDLKSFLQIESKQPNFKGRIIISDVVDVVGTYRHIPNNMTKVYDLIGINFDWIENSNNIGFKTINYLEHILNNYGLSLTSTNDTISNLQSQRDNLKLDILNWNLEKFIINHIPANKQQYLKYLLPDFKKAIITTLNKDNQDITVQDAIDAMKMNLDIPIGIIKVFKNGLKRYENSILQEQITYSLKV